MKTLMSLGATGLLALGLASVAAQPSAAQVDGGGTDRPRQPGGATVQLAAAQRGVFKKERQPNMQRALNNLEQARDDLQRANRDKGGHRARAIELINQALREVRAGARYDFRH